MAIGSKDHCLLTLLNCQHLEVLDVGNNQFESINLTIKGNDIKVKRILTAFGAIDLSSNRF